MVQKYPVFGEADREIFSIDGSRPRADRLKEVVVPKLFKLARMAFEEIEDFYGKDLLDDSSESSSPDHRSNAKRTRLFTEAAAGLVKRQFDGKYFYIKIQLILNRDQMYVSVNASRPRESQVILDLLKQYKEEYLEFLDYLEIGFWSENADAGRLSNADMIDAADVDESKQWWTCGLIGGCWGFPIDVEEIADELIECFLVMFPLYQAACELLAGREHRFSEYLTSLRKYFEGDDHEAVEDEEFDVEDGPDSDEPAFEGGLIESVRRHRRRESWKRAEKIQEVLARTGSLGCEVPGCGFDFLKTYGERGRGFAHVHHSEPLGSRSEPSETKLADLMIVCANCHAMIHRGEWLTSFDGLIQRDSTSRD